MCIYMYMYMYINIYICIRIHTCVRGLGERARKKECTILVRVWVCILCLHFVHTYIPPDPQYQVAT